MYRLLAVIAALVLLSGCDDPPCEGDFAERAAESYKVCIKMQNRGDGGLACGRSAYKTHCPINAVKPN